MPPSTTKILCLVGPTATGKTGVAVSLSHQLPAVIFSADSRQVYRGMDIVTGKDHPSGIGVEGTDIVEPDQPCSVAVWKRAIALSWEFAETTGKLPILAGGTGLYLQSILGGIPTMDIPPDDKLRGKLAGLDVTELQARLRCLDPARLVGMNHSDAHNPRRLVRAIEVALFHRAQLREFHYQRPGLTDYLALGLKYFDNSIYESVVRQRVEDRINQGAIDETRQLLLRYGRNISSLSAIGYRSLIRYLDGELSHTELVDLWTRDELNYAKRQLTWFRKMPGIVWTDAADPMKADKIAKLVTTWYDKN